MSLWEPSATARARVAQYPEAFAQIVKSREGDTRTAWCAAGCNSALWQETVFSCYGLYPSNVTLEPANP